MRPMGQLQLAKIKQKAAYTCNKQVIDLEHSIFTEHPQTSALVITAQSWFEMFL